MINRELLTEPTERQKKCKHCWWWTTEGKTDKDTILCIKDAETLGDIEDKGVYVPCAKCETCKDFKSKFIEYPLTINSINNKGIEYSDFRKSQIGKFASIRPCGDEYEGKTYLGMFLGHLPRYISITHNEDDNVLNVGTMDNPAIFVFELQKIIFGDQSWWSIIDSPEDLKDITDDTINSQWYIQLAKAMTNTTKEN